MDRKEFFNWLDTCPTHKFECDFDESGFISISFQIQETEESGEIDKNENIYQSMGFFDRKEYIESLAAEYGHEVVYRYAKELGASEDFTGLVEELENNWLSGSPEKPTKEYKL